MSKLRYRADIDGLRAVSVLLIIYFHLGFRNLPGAFVAVDVFFVISGFLITAILLYELDAGKFSIANFYERRVRRLWPGLIFALVGATVGGLWLLLPQLLVDFGQSLAAVSLFSSNVLFWTESGYFDGPSELKPLLHTWTLSVEEQFYVVFPTFLLLLHRWFRPHIRLGLILACVVSLAIGTAQLPTQQSAAFYMLPARAWELVFGGLLGIGMFTPFKSVRAASISGMAGIGGLAALCFLYWPEMPFPGITAVPPVVATSMIIHAGLTPGALSAKILSWNPMVLVGKSSYSMYLWHWPIIVYARVLRPDGLSMVEIVLIAIACVAMGFVGWRLVEEPCRRSKRFGRRTVLIAGAVSNIAWIGLGAGLHLSRGLPGRISGAALAFEEATRSFNPSPETCFDYELELEQGDQTFCRIGVEAAPPSFFLWGDSHSGIFVHAASAAAEATGRSGLISIVPSCPPIPGLAKDDSAMDDGADLECQAVNDRAMAAIAAVPSIDRVVFVGRWPMYVRGRGVGLDADKTLEVWPADGARGEGKQGEVFLGAFEAHIQRLRELGKQVILLRSMPEIDDFDARLLANLAMLDGEELSEETLARTRVSREVTRTRMAPVDAMFATFESDAGVTVLDPTPYFCDEDTCSALRDGEVLYFDNNHINDLASRRLGELLEPAFAK